MDREPNMEKSRLLSKSAKLDKQACHEVKPRIGERRLTILDASPGNHHQSRSGRSPVAAAVPIAAGAARRGLADIRRHYQASADKAVGPCQGRHRRLAVEERVVRQGWDLPVH
jgi:hypothetical protein